MAKISNEQIVAALLSSTTNNEAAEKLGIAERTLYDRMRSLSFKELYEEAKDRIVDDALDKAQRALSRSIDTMVELMENRDIPAQTRLNAAVAIRQTVTKLNRQIDDTNPFASIDRMLRR